MQCFDPEVPVLNPNQNDYSVPTTVVCAGCGLSILNTDARDVHQAFHDRVEPDGN